VDYTLIGYPGLAEAPEALVAQARVDEHAREVLVDWLGERGVGASADVLERMLTPYEPLPPGWGEVGSLPDDLAVPLASHDRLTGYHASGSELEQIWENDLSA
jgi:hypothetical protein